MGSTDLPARATGVRVAALTCLAIAIVAGCAAVPGSAAPAPPVTGSRPVTPDPPTTAPPPTSGAAPTTDPASGPTTAPPTRQPPASDALRSGDTGPAVLAVQNRLSDLGYWLGTPDGSFGSLTQQAVLALQGAAGLHRDGALGPATRTALDAGTRPRARSQHGAVTEIDRDAGLVSFVVDGKVQVSLHTSTGSFRTYTHDGSQHLADTPAGHFTVAWAHDGWRDGALGRLYRPRYFHPDGIAVHGYPSVPAYPASHGCARVSEAAIDMVWARDLMPIDSAVWVY